MAPSYTVGEFEVRPDERRVLCGGAPVALGSRAFDLLLCLIEHRDRVVDKSELLELVWPGVVVEEANLTVHVSALRKLLGAQAVATVPGRGYRFAMAVAETNSEAPVREVRHSLPAERDTFVGRAEALDGLSQRIQSGARLVSVLGLGGTGKTRLATRYGRNGLGEFPGGVWFCDLAPARSLDGVVSAVAQGLHVPLGRDDPVVQLGHAIAGRGRCLMILDNFEQVARHARSTLGSWLDRAEQACFVVTTREVLGLPGEDVLTLPPLPSADGVALFVLRAEAARSDFHPGTEDQSAIAPLVDLLDGLPLAIELAAARVRVMPPRLLLQRMSRERFKLLVSKGGRPERQSTLRAAFDWSWDLLPPHEKAALAQLSVFEGGFTLEAAEAVIDLTAFDDAPWSVDAIHALVDKSFVRPRGDDRFDLLVSVQAYAAEKLEASGREIKRSAEKRHGGYFAGYGTDAARESLCRHGGIRRRRALALELDNLVAACRRAVGRADGEDAVDAYQAIWEVLETQGPCALGIDLGAQVLAIDHLDAAQRAAALPVRGIALRRAGRSDEAASEFEQGLALCRSIGDRRHEAFILAGLGNLRRDQGRIEDARVHLEAALVIARQVGNRRLEGNLVGNLGIVHAAQGRYDEAREHFEQALVIHCEVGDRRMEGVDTSNLGNVYLDRGLADDAHIYFNLALAIDREVGNRREEAIVTCNLGLICRARGRAEEAQAFFETALAITREVGDRPFEGFLLGDLGELLRDEGRLDEARGHLDLALAIHQGVGNRSYEGSLLGSLGVLLARQGRLDEAREKLRTGEEILRLGGDQSRLVALLCDRVLVEVAAADRNAARAALAAAEHIAEALGAGLTSEVAGRLVTLREALA